ncbi:acetylglucosamine transferase [Acidisphaera sp. S103]|uniref:O-linked N-acetylglucosamine transferase, SPINDLY family protein n=1 Tax=Acidisphaera sp. S103 TaxID=1747223 RepID=UPI00131E55F8|nr:acetylglucosamine transferase [Acidisphaera sp. S103]
MASTDPRLAAAPFRDVVAAAEAIGSGRGLPMVVALYTAWIAAQAPYAPDLPAAWFNLGTELGHAEDAAGAIQAYRAALAAHPGFAHAAVNLGLLLERLGEPQTALKVWTEALQPDDSRIALLNQRGRLLEQSGDLAGAADALRASLLTRHDQPDAVQHWLHLRQKMCQWPVLAETIPGLTRTDLIAQSGPLAALALTDDVPTQCAIAAGWVARKTQPKPALAPVGGYRHDRIRIGYLSSDFCSHAMSYLIAELFERHDRSRFEVHGYCASPDDGSPIRDRVIGAFDRYTSVRSMSDEAAARRIRSDEIDILIDLNGLTSGGRLQILRWKPAPVQATYLGFIGPVPLPELDFLLCDDFVIPSDVAAAYQPVPLPIEGLYQANDSKRVVGAPMTRRQVGLPDDRFVFCCFSNHYKITETMFAGWMEILRGTDDSVLWLVDDNQWSRANLKARVLVAGVDPSRILFAERTDPASYMGRLAAADVFLDTFPYNAGTIASDAIRMGLPLLTLAGRSFASRMAARMLYAIGADDGVTETLEAYVAAAVGLATDRDRYKAYRARFSEAAWSGSLGDIAGFTKRFEAALLRMAGARGEVETVSL